MESQTPEQLQFLSNTGHIIEGALFAIVGLIALLQAWGYLTSGRAQYLWPSLIAQLSARAQRSLRLCGECFYLLFTAETQRTRRQA